MTIVSAELLLSITIAIQKDKIMTQLNELGGSQIKKLLAIFGTKKKED